MHLQRNVRRVSMNNEKIDECKGRLIVFVLVETHRSPRYGKGIFNRGYLRIIPKFPTFAYNEKCIS